MQVKIDGKIYDPDKQSIVLLLTERDRELITKAPPENTKWCFSPEGTTPEEMDELMLFPADPGKVLATRNKEPVAELFENPSDACRWLIGKFDISPKIVYYKDVDCGCALWVDLPLQFIWRGAFFEIKKVPK
jgi:hypothetical protein